MSAAMDLHLGQVPAQRQVFTLAQQRLAHVLALDDHELAEYLDDLVTQNPALARALDVAEGRAPRGAPPRPAPPGEADAAPRTLCADLADQLRLELDDDEALAAGLEILGDLDDRGMLATDAEDLARRAGTTPAVIEEVRAVIMRLDPPGCAARTLREYLQHMVHLLWPDDPFFPQIIEGHLEHLHPGGYARIAAAIDQEPEDVEEYHRMLTDHVDPTPARGRTIGVTPAARPTVEVRRCATSGAWRAHVEDDAQPELRLDPAFLDALRRLPPGPERSRRELQVRRAREALRDLEARQSILRQVVDVAVARQQAFFELGEDHLRPLTMTAVATLLGRDTSTISRVVSGRWLHWPGGVLRLRDLFPVRAGAAGATVHALRAELRRLVREEDPRKPRSDEELARLLRRGGIPASRRSVQKHRDRLGIPPSRDRRIRSGPQPTAREASPDAIPTKTRTNLDRHLALRTPATEDHRENLSRIHAGGG